jgi:hypothetical protein
MADKVEERLPTVEQLLLTKCLNMCRSGGVCPDSTVEELIHAICFSHERGYLYANRKANSFVCGYRIPEVNDKWKCTIPEKEEGEIFFVNFAVSEEPNSFVLLKMLRSYLKENPDVKELVYFRRNNDKDFKRIHIKGAVHV